MENKRTAGYFSSTTNYYYYTPANAEISYSRLSPKLGAVFELNYRHHLYATYNQGFRTPSESQLFRGGRASTQAEALALSNAANALKAIEAEQYEVGLRGNGKGYKYDVVVYQLTKKNDLLSQKDSTGYAVQTNNGETTHTGIELGFEKSINDQFVIYLATDLFGINTNNLLGGFHSFLGFGSFSLGAASNMRGFGLLILSNKGTKLANKLIGRKRIF
jgi:outer membrane receptor protein involved in Fe transport